MRWPTETAKERRARQTGTALRIGFLLLILLGIFGLLSGCETIHYMACSLKGDC